MYAEKLKQFENVENLGGKAWQHARSCDLLEQEKFKDCSMHCFHFQQLFELLLKHILETRTEFGAYPLIHKLDRLLKQVVKETSFNADAESLASELNALTVCAEAYRYNFLLNCDTYKSTVERLNPLLDELAQFAQT
jgi:HEPN domain-containing protein